MCYTLRATKLLLIGIIVILFSTIVSGQTLTQADCQLIASECATLPSGYCTETGPAAANFGIRDIVQKCNTRITDGYNCANYPQIYSPASTYYAYFADCYDFTGVGYRQLLEAKIITSLIDAGDINQIQTAITNQGGSPNLLDYFNFNNALAARLRGTDNPFIRKTRNQRTLLEQLPANTFYLPNYAGGDRTRKDDLLAGMIEDYAEIYAGVNFNLWSLEDMPSGEDSFRCDSVVPCSWTFDSVQGNYLFEVGNLDVDLKEMDGITISVPTELSLPSHIPQQNFVNSPAIFADDTAKDRIVPFKCGGKDVSFKATTSSGDQVASIICAGTEPQPEFLIFSPAELTIGEVTLRSLSTLRVTTSPNTQNGVYITPEGNVEVKGTADPFEIIYNCGTYAWTGTTWEPTRKRDTQTTCTIDPNAPGLQLLGGTDSATVSGTCMVFETKDYCYDFGDSGNYEIDETCSCEIAGTPEGSVGAVTDGSQVTAENCAASIGLPPEYDITEMEMQQRCASNGGMYCPGAYESICLRKVKGRDIPEDTSAWVNELVERVNRCDMGDIVACSVGAGLSGTCQEIFGLPADSPALSNAAMNAMCMYCDGGTASLCERKLHEAGGAGVITQEDVDRINPKMQVFIDNCAAGMPTGCQATELTSEELAESCGDQTCDAIGGETADNCPTDCGEEETTEETTSETITTLTSECTPGKLEQCFPAQEDYTCTYSRTCDQNGTWGSCTKTDSNCPAPCTPGFEMSCPRQFGVCAGAKQICSGSSWPGCQDIYAGIEGYSTTEICGDFLDNNCNGLVDENCACGLGDDRSCGSDVGACALGTQTCENALVSNTCNGGVNPRPELCNDGIDNDCDGSIDEGCACGQTFGEGFERTCGENACGSGTQTCQDNNGQIVWGECIGNIIPQIESCGDDIDNDCDGSINEGCGCDADRSCGESEIGICSLGTQECTDSGLFATCTGAVLPSTEICGDKIDNNCDGSIDEDCPCAEGEKQECSGVGVCAGLIVTCNAEGKYPACDFGNITGYELKETSCSDGVDNDCDGIIDNEDPDCKETSTSITCSDGTPNNACSTTKPNYCDGGTLTQRCSLCTCDTGSRCDINGKCVADVQPKPTAGTNTGTNTGTTCNFDGICGITEDPITCSDCAGEAEGEKESNTLIWVAIALILVGIGLAASGFVRENQIKEKQKKPTQTPQQQKPQFKSQLGGTRNGQTKK